MFALYQYFTVGKRIFLAAAAEAFAAEGIGVFRGLMTDRGPENITISKVALNLSFLSGNALDYV